MNESLREGVSVSKKKKWYSLIDKVGDPSISMRKGHRKVESLAHCLQIYIYIH